MSQFTEKLIVSLEKDGTLPLLARAVEIAKILNWKEEIWDKEGELESQISSMALEELLQLDVEKLCKDTYSEIPLEV